MKKLKALKIFTFTSLILLLYINSEEVYCQEKELIGKYKYIPISKFPSDTIILEIKEKTLNALENREKILEEYKLWREKNKQDALKNLKEVLE